MLGVCVPALQLGYDLLQSGLMHRQQLDAAFAPAEFSAYPPNFWMGNRRLKSSIFRLGDSRSQVALGSGIRFPSDSENVASVQLLFSPLRLPHACSWRHAH